ncbi:MAG: beta-N-acetylhexosaminidase [Bacteroidaceae bacterium]|nr:beta-N-acetylhexosaminidase [Bacteroidaceae bacterium]
MSLKYAKILILWASCLCPLGLQAELNALIPMPQQVQEGQGEFLLTDGLTIGYNHKSLRPAAEYLKDKLATATGYGVRVKKGSGTISLQLAGQRNDADESYTLTADGSGVHVTAAGYKGIIHGISTLRQLLPHEVESARAQTAVKWSVPYVKIKDRPSYEWRGLMLDPARHFYTMDETKRFLDMMCLYKFSKFHWHLIDTQAWRIEIKKYPLLTQKGAWRNPNREKIDYGSEMCAQEWNDPNMHLPQNLIRVENGDTLYGGYYSQKEIGEIVAYAAVRGIDVVPEIDFPGHNHKATRCYDWLSCHRDGLDPLCVGKDSVIKFCQDVYKEIFKLFPYEYVEIGGDEVRRYRWETCPNCQARIRREGLKDITELQAWFTRTMEKYFNRHGRMLIGWDEILEGGVSRTATVNWWRGYKAGVVQKATDGGNQVICCPTTFCYFDYAQDDSTLQKLYEGNIVPAQLTPAQLRLVKGMQANIWGEYIPTEARMQFMVFPRALALAEKAWNTTTLRPWTQFAATLTDHLPRLQAMGVNYRPLKAGFTNGFNTRPVHLRTTETPLNKPKK